MKKKHLLAALRAAGFAVTNAVPFASAVDCVEALRLSQTAEFSAPPAPCVPVRLVLDFVDGEDVIHRDMVRPAIVPEMPAAQLPEPPALIVVPVPAQCAKCGDAQLSVCPDFGLCAECNAMESTPGPERPAPSFPEPPAVIVVPVPEAAPPAERVPTLAEIMAMLKRPARKAAPEKPRARIPLYEQVLARLDVK